MTCIAWYTTYYWPKTAILTIFMLAQTNKHVTVSLYVRGLIVILLLQHLLQNYLCDLTLRGMQNEFSSKTKVKLN